MTGKRIGYGVACGLLAAGLGWSAVWHLAHRELSPDAASAAGALELLAAAVLLGPVFARGLRRRRRRSLHIVLLGAELAGACEPPPRAGTP